MIVTALLLRTQTEAQVTVKQPNPIYKSYPTKYPDRGYDNGRYNKGGENQQRDNKRRADQDETNIFGKGIGKNRGNEDHDEGDHEDDETGNGHHNDKKQPNDSEVIKDHQNGTHK